MVTQGLALTKALGTDMVEKAVTKRWRRGSETQRGEVSWCYWGELCSLFLVPVIYSHCPIYSSWILCDAVHTNMVGSRSDWLWLSAHSWTHWVSGSLAGIRPSSGTDSKKKKWMFSFDRLFHWTWVKLLDIKDILRITEVKRLKV